MKRFGFVGLPNVGKSTLYNALAGGGAHVGPYAFATTDSNVGVAKVPDDRLTQLAQMSNSTKVVPAAVQFTDIGGLVEGASKGDGLGNAFLAHIREVDAVVFVLRSFGGTEVPGSSDPLDQLRIVETELALADLASAEKALHRYQRMARGDRALEPMVGLLESCVAYLSEGVPLSRSELSADERQQLREFFFLTNKAVMAVVNVDEDQIEGQTEIITPIEVELGGAEVIALSVQLEAEAIGLADEDRAELLQGLGLGNGAIETFLTRAYRLLGLQTFLTTGEKESRAWTFGKGATAPECAGVIHSDLQRGFIRAETIAWDELLLAGSWQAAKELGKVRSEGKDYVVADGDVLEIRFSK